jgi:uncharacterized membrane protein
MGADGNAHGDAHAHAHGDPLFSLGLDTINRAAGFIILFACGVAALNAALLALSHATGRPFRMRLAVTQQRSHVSLDRIQLEFGRLIASSLLVLVGADVIETLVHPLHDLSMETLQKMMLMGVLRTGLAYFLAKEVEHLAHHVTHEDHGHGHADHVAEGAHGAHSSPAEAPTESSGKGKRESKKSK